MIKLYVLYIVFGLYMLMYSLLMWFFPFGYVLGTDVALAGSFVLYFVAPAICLYKPKFAPALGLLCLAAISPFGIHWLQYRIMNDYFIVWDMGSILMCAAVVWYLVTIVVTINIYTVRHNLKVAYYSKKQKLILACLPVPILVILFVYLSLQ
jgi:hypothetical protein